MLDFDVDGDEWKKGKRRTSNVSWRFSGYDRARGMVQRRPCWCDGKKQHMNLYISQQRFPKLPVDILIGHCIHCCHRFLLLKLFMRSFCSLSVRYTLTPCYIMVSGWKTLLLIVFPFITAHKWDLMSNARKLVNRNDENGKFRIP